MNSLSFAHSLYLFALSLVLPTSLSLSLAMSPSLRLSLYMVWFCSIDMALSLSFSAVLYHQLLPEFGYTYSSQHFARSLSLSSWISLGCSDPRHSCPSVSEAGCHNVGLSSCWPVCQCVALSLGVHPTLPVVFYICLGCSWLVTHKPAISQTFPLSLSRSVPLSIWFALSLAISLVLSLSLPLSLSCSFSRCVYRSLIISLRRPSALRNNL